MRRPLLVLMAVDSMLEILQRTGSLPSEMLLEIDFSRMRITSDEPSPGSYLEALQVYFKLETRP